MNPLNAYDFTLSLIPRLESDVDKYDKIIQKVSELVLEMNKNLLGENLEGKFEIFNSGKILFPYYSFGSVKSYFHLEYRELVLFAIYRKILGGYSRFLDIGGNLGLHSIVASKISRCQVFYFEPDPSHYEEAERRFEINNLKKVVMNKKAISNFEGKAFFVRVLDNTTSSHISGSKANPYGPLEKFEVSVSAMSAFIAEKGRTFAKIDIEGTEVDALKDLSFSDWERFDCVAEITDKNSAKGIMEIARLNNLFLYSQKISWNVASDLEELPHRWDQGSVLISRSLKRESFLD